MKILIKDFYIFATLLINSIALLDKVITLDDQLNPVDSKPIIQKRST